MSDSFHPLPLIPPCPPPLTAMKTTRTLLCKRKNKKPISGMKNEILTDGPFACNNGPRVERRKTEKTATGEQTKILEGVKCGGRVQQGVG